ncbi:methyl-CpG-binding domain protein 4-like protein [Lotus japonicus]|uniref:methyl-CpG-binding domain protein 4-like protein n=1 Tax=Lotus japonicus TaxID=34305 RepID=UPI00258EDCE7|nr:methyl-CpG-binding domain protein 4-like protein [Lotus japonicus]
MSSLNEENKKKKAIESKKKKLKRKKPIWCEEQIDDVVKSPKKTTLSQTEMKDEAYKRKTPDIKWVPPQSPLKLLQEAHYHDPWKVMVICMLLNKSTGLKARSVISELFRICPDAKACTRASTNTLEQVIHGIGFQKQRAARLKRFSEEYLGKHWTHVTQLHGIGKYGADAYAIFCTGKWQRVTPADNYLDRYWEFLHDIKDTL